jgi:dolichol-phosphate hexosyltransferase
MLVSIIIPAINEEAGIGHTINSIPTKLLNEKGYTTEILVIDGKSSDRTSQIAKECGARVITESRKGYGQAYKTGFSVASGDLIVTLDADGTYPTHLIPNYLEELCLKDLDFVSVNRFSKLHTGSMSILHFLGNRILSYTLSVLYSISVSDSQSGMWILRKEFMNKINLSSNDMSLSEEIKIIAFKYFTSLEVAGEYSKRFGDAKLSSIKHGWHNFWYLFKYRRLMKSAVKPLIATIELTNLSIDGKVTNVN